MLINEICLEFESFQGQLFAEEEAERLDVVQVDFHPLDYIASVSFAILYHTALDKLWISLLKSYIY